MTLRESRRPENVGDRRRSLQVLSSSLHQTPPADPDRGSDATVLYGVRACEENTQTRETHPSPGAPQLCSARPSAGTAGRTDRGREGQRALRRRRPCMLRFPCWPFLFRRSYHVQHRTDACGARGEDPIDFLPICTVQSSKARPGRRLTFVSRHLSCARCGRFDWDRPPGAERTRVARNMRFSSEMCFRRAPMR